MRCPKCGVKINPASVMAKQRAKSLSKQRRHEIALKAARARWDKEKNK